MKEYEITLRSEGRWLDVEFDSLWRYRDLLTLLVWRDFVSRYKQTMLGPLWFVLQPLLMTVVFTVVFGNIAALSTDGLPAVLFYMCGQLAWGYFAQTLNANATTFVSNAALFGKVYFPRLIVPLAGLVSNLLAFAIQLLVFLAFVAFFRWKSPDATFGPGWQVIFFPALLMQAAALSFGMGLITSSLGAKYRDLTHLTTLLTQVWMYATPVIYPLSSFPARWRWVAAVNPMTPVVESYRLIFLGTGTVETAHVVWSVTCALLLVIVGLVLFGRIEKTFADIA